MKKHLIPISMWLLFEAIAVVLWLTMDNIFYLFNFSYLGICLSIGVSLYAKKVRYARNVVQFAVGLYMLIYLGILSRENMQIEGFWYYLFLGVFEAAVIHYAVAKILGPLLFGRGWCGYACWTAMILDLLPHKIPARPRKKIGFIRYIIFAFSLLFVGALFVLHVPGIEPVSYTHLAAALRYSRARPYKAASSPTQQPRQGCRQTERRRPFLFRRSEPAPL